MGQVDAVSRRRFLGILAPVRPTVVQPDPWHGARTLLLVLPLLLGWAPEARAQGASRPVSEARLPNLVGASGLLDVPSAYVQRDWEISAFLGGEASHGGAGGALFGVANRLEAGLSAAGSSLGSAKMLGSAKLSAVPEQLLRPAVAVGVLDAWNAAGKGASGYGVVSKSVIPYFVEAATGQQRLALTLHAGYGGGFYRHNLFAGAELWEARGLGAVGELAHGNVSLGARCYYRGFSATVAWMDLDHIGGVISYGLSLR
jgi:hypothetical protein